jgi:2-polyprenyl-3-methyl-5-hydroxy-6-metoxy-1,4-benzoquinol methylase
VRGTTLDAMTGGSMRVDGSTAARVRELFDVKAATWSAKYEPGGRLTGRLALLAENVAQCVCPGGSVLDLGCATGDLARDLAAAGLRVTGCDISAPMLEHAAQADPGGAVSWTRLEPGWRTLPFPAATFDVVVAASVLEYVDDPAAVLRECARLLRPGATLLCTVPDLRHPVRWLERLAGLLVRLPVVSGTVRRSSAWTQYVTYLQISRQRRPLRWWYSAAGLGGLYPVRLRPDRGHLRLLRPLRPLRPLRLLALRRPARPGEPPPGPAADPPRPATGRPAPWPAAPPR